MKDTVELWLRLVRAGGGNAELDEFTAASDEILAYCDTNPKTLNEGLVRKVDELVFKIKEGVLKRLREEADAPSAKELEDMLNEVDPLLHRVSKASDYKPASKSETKVVTKGKNVDEKMLATIRDNADAMYRSSAQWAESLRCAKSTVIDTKTWKQICLPARERERLAHGRRLRRKKPR